MVNSNYKLRYLPLFYKDLEEIVVYISEKLENPKAANDLLNQVEKAITERLPFAESFEKYLSVKDRTIPYYRIYVKNYIVFYVVLDDVHNNKIMEIRRILFNKQQLFL